MSDLELAPDTAAVTVEAPVDAGDPLAVYLARLTSPESRRAMAASLELLAELLVDGQPAGRTERARRRRAGQPLAAAVPWHQLRYGHTQALRSWLAEHCSPPAGTWPPPGGAPGSLAPRPHEWRGSGPGRRPGRRPRTQPSGRPLRRRRRGPPPGRCLPGRRLPRRPPRRRRAGGPL